MTHAVHSPDRPPMPLPVGPTPKSSAWMTVLLLSLLYVISYVDRFALIVLVPMIKAELGITDTQIAFLIGTSFAVCYTFFALPISWLSDRVNRRNLILAGAMVWNLMTALCSLAWNYETLLVLRVGVAVGEAALLPAALSMIADLFPRDRRRVPTSFFLSVGSTGSAGALLIAAACLDIVTWQFFRMLPIVGDLGPWRLVLLLLGTIGLIVTCGFGWLAAEPPRHEPVTRANGVLRHLRENKLLYMGYLGSSSMISMTTISFISWFPNNLVRVHGLDPATAGYIFGLIGIVTTIIGGALVPALSTIVEKKGRGDAIIAVAMIATLLATPLLLGSLLSPAIGASLLFAVPGLLVQVGMNVMMIGALSVLPPAYLRGQVTAIFMLTTNLVGLGAGPLLVGWLSDAWHETPDGLGYALVVLLMLTTPIQLLLLACCRRPFARAIRQIRE